MNNYDRNEVVKLLDASTIKALLAIYQLNYDSIAFRLRCTRANVTYKNRTNSWKLHELRIVYDLFKENGCDDTFISIIHLMTSKQKQAKGRVNNND